MQHFTCKTVTKVTGVPGRTLDFWARSGVARPALDRGPGRGLGKQYTFAELVGVKAIAALRDQGVSLQRVRRLLPELAKVAGDDGTHLERLARVRLAVVGDGDVAVVQDDAHLISLLKQPGQAISRPLLLDLGSTVAELRQKVAALPASERKQAA
jgi:DNA-binding transcriptional MerR regulator